MKTKPMNIVRGTLTRDEAFPEASPEPSRDPNPVHHAVALIERMDETDLNAIVKAVCARLSELSASEPIRSPGLRRLRASENAEAIREAVIKDGEAAFKSVRRDRKEHEAAYQNLLNSNGPHLAGKRRVHG